MADTKIEWAQKVWNPVRGCSRISPGCGQGIQGGCYAERQAIRMAGPSQPYEGLVKSTSSGPRWTGIVKPAPNDVIKQPIHWQKPTRIFVNSMSDLFHEKLDNLDIANIWKVMRACPQHQFLILTKRAQGMRLWVEQWVAGGGEILPNVWLGVSIESPEYLSRMSELLRTPAAVHWISYEPALAQVSFQLHPDGHLCQVCGDTDHQAFECHQAKGKISWVVVGGESGPNARPFNVEWARFTIRQCKAAGVAVFVKQLGAEPRFRLEDEERMGNTMPSFHHSQGELCIKKLNDSKGGDPAEWPEDLRVRQFPTIQPVDLHI